MEENTKTCTFCRKCTPWNKIVGRVEFPEFGEARYLCELCAMMICAAFHGLQEHLIQAKTGAIFKKAMNWKEAEEKKIAESQKPPPVVGPPRLSIVTNPDTETPI